MSNRIRELFARYNANSQENTDDSHLTPEEERDARRQAIFTMEREWHAIVNGDCAGESNPEADTFIKEHRDTLLSHLDDIEINETSIKHNRAENKEFLVLALVEAYIIAEQARKDDDVLKALRRSYKKSGTLVSIDNPAIMVVEADFQKSKGTLSIYSTVLQLAHEGAGGLGRPMTPEELGEELRS